MSIGCELPDVDAAEPQGFAPSRTGALVGGALIVLAGVLAPLCPGGLGQVPFVETIQNSRTVPLPVAGLTSVGDVVSLVVGAVVWIGVGVFAMVAARRKPRLVVGVGLAVWALFSFIPAVEHCLAAATASSDGFLDFSGIVTGYWLVASCLTGLAIGLCARAAAACRWAKVLGIVVLSVLLAMWLAVGAIVLAFFDSFGSTDGLIAAAAALLVVMWGSFLVGWLVLLASFRPVAEPVSG